MKNKFASGRFWLAVCAGAVFVVKSADGSFPPDLSASIVSMVFTMYFLRNRDAEARPAATKGGANG